LNKILNTNNFWRKNITINLFFRASIRKILALSYLKLQSYQVVTLSNPLLKPAQFYLKEIFIISLIKKRPDKSGVFHKYFRVYSFIKEISALLLCAFPAAVLLVSIGLVSPNQWNLIYLL
jgi:hypothetical protein